VSSQPSRAAISNEPNGAEHWSWLTAALVSVTGSRLEKLPPVVSLSLPLGFFYIFNIITETTRSFTTFIIILTNLAFLYLQLKHFYHFS